VAKKYRLIFVTRMCTIVSMRTCYPPYLKSPSIAYFKVLTIILNIYTSVFQVVSFPTTFLSKLSMLFLSTQNILRSLHFPFFMILSSDSRVITNHEATHYTIPPAHNETVTTDIGHPVCGRRVEYILIFC